MDGGGHIGRNIVLLAVDMPAEEVQHRDDVDGSENTGPRILQDVSHFNIAMNI